MIGFAVILLGQSVTAPFICSRDEVEQVHANVLKSLQTRVHELVEERRSLMTRRSELAKRSVKLAEMSSVKRGVSEAFGQSQEDLERLDVAYTARINTIADEAGVIQSDVKIEQARHDADILRCGIK